MGAHTPPVRRTLKDANTTCIWIHDNPKFYVALRFRYVSNVLQYKVYFIKGDWVDNVSYYGGTINIKANSKNGTTILKWHTNNWYTHPSGESNWHTFPNSNKLYLYAQCNLCDVTTGYKIFEITNNIKNVSDTSDYEAFKNFKIIKKAYTGTTLTVQPVWSGGDIKDNTCTITLTEYSKNSDYNKKFKKVKKVYDINYKNKKFPLIRFTGLSKGKLYEINAKITDDTSSATASTIHMRTYKVSATYDDSSMVYDESTKTYSINCNVSYLRGSDVNLNYIKNHLLRYKLLEKDKTTIVGGKTYEIKENTASNNGISKTVTFSNLKIGLYYLRVWTKATANSNNINDTVITIPIRVENNFKLSSTSKTVSAKSTINIKSNKDLKYTLYLYRAVNSSGGPTISKKNYTGPGTYIFNEGDGVEPGVNYIVTLLKANTVTKEAAILGESLISTYKIETSNVQVGTKNIKYQFNIKSGYGIDIYKNIRYNVLANAYTAPPLNSTDNEKLIYYIDSLKDIRKTHITNQLYLPDTDTSSFLTNCHCSRLYIFQVWIEGISDSYTTFIVPTCIMSLENTEISITDQAITSKWNCKIDNRDISNINNALGVHELNTVEDISDSKYCQIDGKSVDFGKLFNELFKKDTPNEVYLTDKNGIFIDNNKKINEYEDLALNDELGDNSDDTYITNSTLLYYDLDNIEDGSTLDGDNAEGVNSSGEINNNDGYQDPDNNEIGDIEDGTIQDADIVDIGIDFVLNDNNILNNCHAYAISNDKLGHKDDESNPTDITFGNYNYNKTLYSYVKYFNNSYVIRCCVTDGYNIVRAILNCSTRAPYMLIYVNGEWVKAIPYIYIQGEWMKTTPYVYKDGKWHLLNS